MQRWKTGPGPSPPGQAAAGRCGLRQARHSGSTALRFDFVNPMLRACRHGDRSRLAPQTHPVHQVIGIHDLVDKVHPRPRPPRSHHRSGSPRCIGMPVPGRPARTKTWKTPRMGDLRFSPFYVKTKQRTGPSIARAGCGRPPRAAAGAALGDQSACDLTWIIPCYELADTVIGHG